MYKDAILKDAILNDNIKKQLYPLFKVLLDIIIDVLYPLSKSKVQNAKEILTQEKFLSLIMKYNIEQRKLEIRRYKEDFDKIVLYNEGIYIYDNINPNGFMDYSKLNTHNIRLAVNTILEFLEKKYRNVNQNNKAKVRLWNIDPIMTNSEFGEIEGIILGSDGTGGRKVLVPMTKIENNDAEWIVRLSGEGTYSQSTYGTVYILTADKEKINVIHYGSNGYGVICVMGSWYEFLVGILDTPVRFVIRPSGNKLERYWMVFDKNKVYTVKPQEIDIFNKMTGITIPKIDIENKLTHNEDEGNIIDLIDMFDVLKERSEALILYPKGKKRGE